ncbi:hypothetical protein HYV12_00195 [Candidatus Dojkabacteria bacterium]|nr:hypothetical protein [Candidatus Dojkabacteria bacterium]
MDLNIIEKYRKGWHRNLLTQIYASKFEVVLKGNYSSLFLNHQIVLNESLSPIGQLAQRDDLHSLPVEDHQKCASLLALSIFSPESASVEGRSLSKAQLKMRNILGAFKGEIVGDEEGSLRSVIGREAREVAQILLKYNIIDITDIENFVIWARYHDEGKYREPELSISVSTGNGNSVEGIPKFESTRRVAKFPNPMFKGDRHRNAHELSEEGTKEFFHELVREGAINEGEGNDLISIHESYEQWDKLVKGDVTHIEVPNRVEKEDMLGIFAVVADECAKKAPFAEDTASPPVREKRYSQLEKTAQMISGLHNILVERYERS